METIEKVLIVIVGLDSNDIYMKRDDIGKHYFAFYGEEIDAAISDKCLFLLIQDKLVTEKCDDIVPTAAGIQQGLEAHNRYYFTKGIKASVKSNADRQYKENKNRGVVKSDSIIDEEQLEFILTELRHCRRAIVDLGCGTGDLAACIQRKLRSKVKGLDNSHEMISIARNSHPNMNWEVGDIENYDDDTEASAFF